VTDKYVVNGRCNHPRIRVIAIYVFERRLFGHFIQDFQQKAEPEIPL
jgi:hypothetical protein